MGYSSYIKQLRARVPEHVIRTKLKALKEMWRKGNYRIPYRQFRDNAIAGRPKKLTTSQVVDEICDKVDDLSMSKEQLKAALMPLLNPSTLGQEALNIVHDRDLARAASFGAAYRRTGNVQAAKNRMS